MHSDLSTIVIWINNQTDWLYTKIYQNQFFFIDFWSFNHLWSGLIIYAILSYYRFNKKFFRLFTILLAYEFIEISIRYMALNIFLPETIKDQFTDILIGMFGALLYILIFNVISNYVTPEKIKKIIILITAVTISFLWVGFYGYKYNFKFLNSPGLNYSAFLMWTAGLSSTLFMYNYLENKFRDFFKAFIVTWILYLVSLFLFEFTTFHIVGGHEISKPNRQPLIFDIIHGTPVMHTVYLLMPAIGITAYYLLLKLFMYEKKEYSIEKINLGLKNSLEI